MLYSEPMGGKTIVFNANHLNVRGTDVALYDYAHFNETLLGNTSLIVSPANADNSNYPKFSARFPVKLYHSNLELESYLDEIADSYYTIVHGQLEWLPNTRAKKLVHAVFEAYTPYGDIYAAVSDWVAQHRSQGSVPVVPHMIHLPEETGDLRQELGIPPNALVFGRHGGYETFNIPFVYDVISNIIYQRQDLYFLFLNTRPFHVHPRILYVEPTSDLMLKTRFINTCNAMIHARQEGESFGLSVGEFSIRNKPVITYKESYDKHHIQLLAEKGIYYSHPDELYHILSTFQSIPGNYDVFSTHFNPEIVMQKFQEVFLA